MRRFRSLPAGVAVGAVMLVAGLASAQSMMNIGSGDVIADRQRLMKLNAASLQDIGDKMKAGNIEAIAVNAETLALNAEHITALFPKGSLSDKSNAKPEIWERWDEFEKAAKNLQVMAEKLRDAARAKDAAAVQAVQTGFFRNNCRLCHTPFCASTDRC